MGRYFYKHIPVLCRFSLYQYTFGPKKKFKFQYPGLHSCQQGWINLPEGPWAEKEHSSCIDYHVSPILCAWFGI